MNQSIKNQISLIEKIIAIGKKIPSDIDSLGKIQLPNDKEDLERAIILNYQKFCIENFFNFADFLLEKIKTDAKQNFQYYVPLLRIFMEIYIDLLFLVNQPRERQAVLCVGNHLFTLAKYIQCESSASLPDSAELARLYREELNQSNAVIKNIGISQDPQRLSRKFMDKNKLSFPSKEITIRNYFMDCSKITRGLFPATTGDKFYESYRTLSDYVHGAVFSLMKKDSPTTNEQFWLIARLEMFSMLVIELANQKIIQDKHTKELKGWIGDFRSNSKDFVEHWKNVKKGNT